MKAKLLKTFFYLTICAGGILSTNWMVHRDVLQGIGIFFLTLLAAIAITVLAEVCGVEIPGDTAPTPPEKSK